MTDKHEDSSLMYADLEIGIQVAVARELERFAEASAQHFASYDRLATISKYKITDPKTNYQQQAGFSAESKQVARANEKNILSGNKTRYARTDDLGAVNHPVYDYAETDPSSGSARIGPDGNFVGGAQMKVHGNTEEYRKLYGSKYDKYESAKLVLPSDQFDTIMQDWDVQEAKLKQQVDALNGKGDTALAKEKQAQIDRIKSARRRAVKSEVSTADAMEARKSPTLSVGKDALRVGHSAGLEASKSAAMVGGGVSVLKNGYDVFKGDKNIGDASLDILTDTGRAALTAYASGAVTATLGGALQAANEQVLRNLGKGNAPATIVQATTILGKSVLDVIAGKITPEQMVAQISREGTTLAMSLTGSNLGAVLGTFVAPGVGTVVGGFVGGMVASIMSGSIHAALQKSVHDLELSNEQRKRTEAFCARMIAEHQAYRKQMDLVFDQFFLEKRTQLKSAFDSMANATLRGESLREGLEGVAQAFGKELAFTGGADVRARLKSGAVLEF